MIGLQVARQFVLAGRPAEALQYLSAEDKVPPHCFDEYAETLDRVYEALGRTDDLRELRKRHFLLLGVAAREPEFIPNWRGFCRVAVDRIARL